VGLAGPIIAILLTVALVRRAEGTKAEVAKQSAFHIRWADEFFDACQKFLCALEQEIAILVFLTHREEKNDERGMKMQLDQGEIHLLAYELTLRIKRCVGFAPQNRENIIRLVDDLFSGVNQLIGNEPSDLVPIFEKIYEFNNCARRAHAEILALGRSNPKELP